MNHTKHKLKIQRKREIEKIRMKIALINGTR